MTPICGRRSRHLPLPALTTAIALFAVATLAAQSNAVRAEGNEAWVSAQFSKSEHANPGTQRTSARQARSRLGGPVDRSERTGGSRRQSLSGGSQTWQASSGCVPGQLRSVLDSIAASFGPVTITSTCRSRAQNRAAGGADQSYHLKGEAVDFRTRGSTGAVYAYLSSSSSVGGLKHYGGGLFHIDTGPRRSW